MSEFILKIQIHFLVLIHQYLFRRYRRIYNHSGDYDDALQLEYHKSMARLLKKKKALITRDEKLEIVLNASRLIDS